MSIKYQSSSRKLPFCSSLTDLEYSAFLQQYAIHNSSLPISERMKYDLSNIVLVERSPNNNSLTVSFSDQTSVEYPLL